MDGYISKPIKAKELFREITNILSPSEEKQETPQGGNNIIDMTEVLERADGDMELVVEIAELFLEDCDQLLFKVRDSITQNDIDTFTRSAHTLKGSAANMSAKSVASIALELEMMGRNGDISRAWEVYKMLEEEIRNLKPVLAGMKNSYV
jgi:HPt (histidine-containing phosphotransfer) domain-containing protein